MISQDVILALNAALAIVIPAGAYFLVSWLRAKSETFQRKQDQTFSLAQKAADQSTKNADALAKNTALTERIAVATDGQKKAGEENARASGYVAGQISERLAQSRADCGEYDELVEMEKSFAPRKDDSK